MNGGDGAWEMKMAHYVPGQEPLRNQLIQRLHNKSHSKCLETEEGDVESHADCKLC